MQHDDNWKEEMEFIASIIYKAPLQKVVKWGADVFTFNGKNVVSYGGFKNYVAVWFFNGVFLKDKYNVLFNAQEGKTKSLRQWRFSSMAEIDEDKIMEYIIEAIEVEKKGLKIAPEKFEPAPLPQLLQEVFKHDKVLKQHFDSLSPGKQKEYVIYIGEAKQEATKQKRIEKIKPMILQRTGLNDKYK